MNSSVPESDSEDELPSLWEERATNDGYVYYVNHQQKITQWTHPRTGKTKRVSGDLPLNWEKQVEKGTGKILFVDKTNGQTTYTDPRLAFAVEEAPTTLGQLRQRFDASTGALQILHGRDLSGKVAVITGANSGIGFETARSLALHGCEIIFACRSEVNAQEAIEKIKAEKPLAGSRCRFVPLDLKSLRSVQKCADTLKQQLNHIDILILNAGVFALPHILTPDRLETTFQVCHLSHFYLTTSLSDLFDQTSRIVVLSSESHRFANLPASGEVTESHLCPPSHKFWSMMAYNNVKLCNVLFAAELARRWQNRGISVFSVHPGNMISTNLTKYFWFYRLVFALVRPFTKSLQQGASTSVYCATANELTGLTGLYFNNNFLCEPSKLAQNETLAKNLWTESERMVASVLGTAETK